LLSTSSIFSASVWALCKKSFAVLDYEKKHIPGGGKNPSQERRNGTDKLLRGTTLIVLIKLVKGFMDIGKVVFL